MGNITFFSNHWVSTHALLTIIIFEHTGLIRKEMRHGKKKAQFVTFV